MTSKKTKLLKKQFLAQSVKLEALVEKGEVSPHENLDLKKSEIEKKESKK